MTEYTIVGLVGIVQIIVSIILIVRQEKVLASCTEIISTLLLFFILSDSSTTQLTISTEDLYLSIGEYAFVKLFLVCFILLARLYSFYEIRALCRKKKKANKLKLKFIKAFHKVKYWPRLKLGLPGKAGKLSPKTKVRFDEKGFPKFKAYYTVRLRLKDFRKTRETHFHLANKELKKTIASRARIKAKFTRKQLKEISQGKTPSGYTWHHHQDAGVLQLVDAEIHAKTPHVGGYSIWGGK